MQRQEILNEVLRKYELKRGVAIEKKNQNTAFYYEKFPKLKEVDQNINILGHESMMNILKNPQNADNLKKEFERKLSELRALREEIIKKNNIDPKYNLPVYECEKCMDTGYLENGEKCECLERALIFENIKNSQMGNLIKADSFDSFSLDFYSDEKNSDGVSHKDVIKKALDCSIHFVNNFDDVDYNLFFYGGTGLGKTFLSSLIGINVMNKGKTVNYVRATKIFSTYEDYKFHDYSKKEEIDELYRCDLLVIDDLGTENATKPCVSFLFDLLNDRLINSKKTIINTNLEMRDFSNTYTVRLTSRIYENFKIFKFLGEDIRIKKLIEKNKGM